MIFTFVLGGDGCFLDADVVAAYRVLHTAACALGIRTRRHFLPSRDLQFFVHLIWRFPAVSTLSLSAWPLT